MSIKFACSCGKAYKVPEKFAGKRVKCKQCGEAIRVPSESETSVQSSRAAAVSKRSVLGGSQRVAQEDDDEEEMDDDEDEAPKPSKTSSKSSKPAPAGASARKPAATSARVETKRKGTGTGRFEVVDLKDELKAYQRKRKEDDGFQRGEGRLTYFAGGKPAKAFRLGKDDVTVGRASGCKVVLPVESVSSEHMKVEYKLGTFIVTDLQSLNGVIVNGRPVRRASVKDGDLLQLGEAILRIDC
jgi:hypothetical protein